MNVEPDPPTILAELKAEIKAELKASEALRQSVSTEELDNAIVLATDYLRTGSETGIGRRLQQFVWSLWNNSHWINLYDLSSYTDRKCTEAMIIMFRAAMVRVLTEDHLRKILTDSGEFARWEDCRASTPDGEAVLYPPLPMSDKTLISLAASVQKSAKRVEEGPTR